MKRAVIHVSGRVQGVLFRVAARRHARRLGITGYVKNEEGGSVTIVAEGQEQALGKLFSWAQAGPPLARVDECTIEWGQETGEFTSFETL